MMSGKLGQIIDKWNLALHLRHAARVMEIDALPHVWPDWMTANKRAQMSVNFRMHAAELEGQAEKEGAAELLAETAKKPGAKPWERECVKCATRWFENESGVDCPTCEVKR